MESVAPTVAPYATGLDTAGRTLGELFPTVDPEFEVFGHRVLVQLRRTISKSAGGIILSRDTKDTEAWNIQVARLIAVGPLAFKNRATGESWPEGAWAKVGDFIKVPRWGGDRNSVPMGDGGDPVVVVTLADSDLIGRYTGNPLAIKAYIA